MTIRALKQRVRRNSEVQTKYVFSTTIHKNPILKFILTGIHFVILNKELALIIS